MRYATNNILHIWFLEYPPVIAISKEKKFEKYCVFIACLRIDEYNNKIQPTLIHFKKWMWLKFNLLATIITDTMILVDISCHVKNKKLPPEVR